MKRILTLLLLIICNFTFASNYYISLSGDDAAAGTSPATAWQSISKVNAWSQRMNPGDSILFRRGDVFYGSLVVTRSGKEGNPITIDAYGNGAKPVLTALKKLSGWKLVSEGIYEAAVNCKYTVNVLTIDGIPQRIGRFPNYDAPNGGYLTWTAYTGISTITAAGLNGINWAGADIIIRKYGYLIERDSITSQKGAVAEYSGFASINPRNDGEGTSPYKPTETGNGLFVQRDIRTLDQFGEWYFNPSVNKMTVYFGKKLPASYTVKTSTIDTLINLNTSSYINISNLELQGANLAAVFYYNNRNITVKNCDINYSGAKGIYGWNSSNALVDSCNFNYSTCGAIDITGRSASNVNVLHTTVKNTGIFAGMGSFHNVADYTGIYISVDSISCIRKNRVDTTGYAGIYFQGAGIVIDSNFVNYYGFIKDDVGGIYTFTTDKGHRVIKNNIILNGIGSTNGNASPAHCEGFYGDGGARGCTVYNNTIAYMSNRGLYFNDPKDLDAQYNTIYQTGAIGWSINKHYNDSIYNVILKNNIFFKVATTKGNGQVYFNSGTDAPTFPRSKSIQHAIQQMGTIDSNYYKFTTDNTAPFYWYHKTLSSGYTFPSAVDFFTWQSFSGFDRHSVDLSKLIGNTDIFVYNDGDSPIVYHFKGQSKKDVYGNVYKDVYTIPGWSSVVLIDN